jgi:iron(III) transport system ATP-binding protein
VDETVVKEMGVTKLAVELRGLTKRFRDGVAVNDVSLTVEDGKVLVLLGPSGCGKTTVLRCIAGLEEPSAGQIFLGGTEVSAAGRSVRPERRQVGMVFQSYALWPHMTVLENVALVCRRQRHLSNARAHERARELLETFGLGAMATRFPGELSGGQQQRVALARAIGGSPKLLLMDEPLSALDQQLREELRAELKREIAATGLACVYVTHDQREALGMADHLAILNAGRVVEYGSPADLYRQPSSQFGAAFLGARNRIAGALVDRGGADGELPSATTAGVRLQFVPCQAGTAEKGARVDLVWRPESTIVRRPADADGEFSSRGTVVAELFLGTHSQVQVRLETGEEILGVLEGPCPPRGDPCQFQVRPKEVFGYENTGQSA